MAVVRFRFRGRARCGLAGLPLIVPFIVLGVSLFLLFIFVDIPRSLMTIAIGHSVVAVPFATLILLARMVGMDANLEDAAMDLGATYPTTLRRIVVPLMAPSMLSALLTCFIVSFDEVAIALFLAGGDPTFPIFLYGQLRFAASFPPHRHGRPADDRDRDPDSGRVPARPPPLGARRGRKARGGGAGGGGFLGGRGGKGGGGRGSVAVGGGVG